MSYFSDREGVPIPRVTEELTESAWGGIAALVNSLVSKGAFGEDYPWTCENGGIIGTDTQSFWMAARGDNPNLILPVKQYNTQPTLVALDLIEFCYEHVSEPNQLFFHDYPRPGHHHLGFDREAGRIQFRESVNTIFQRNGLVYELGPDGHVRRLMPPVLREAVLAGLPRTGDVQLDDMLNKSITKFASPDPEIREDGLKDLWDAFERLKTIIGTKKSDSIKALLDRAASEPKMRAVLEEESRRLTDIGNDFQIRHFETNKTPITESAQVDYLFHRMFSFILLLVKAL